jgi:hypothetical protein
LPRLDAGGQTMAMDATPDASPAADHPPVVTGDDSRWMTFAELAAARGIGRVSAERLVRRHKWRRQPGNDGRVRVLVPSGELRANPRKTDRGDDRPQLLDIVQAALEAQARAESRADALAAELAAERAAVASLEAAITARDAQLARRKRGLLARIRSRLRGVHAGRVSI